MICWKVFRNIGLVSLWNNLNLYFSKTEDIAKKHSVKVLLDDLGYCFKSGGDYGVGVLVGKDDIPRRLSELKDLANQAVYINPKWKKQQKDNIWGYIFDMNIASLPRFVSSRVPLKDDGQKTHE